MPEKEYDYLIVGAGLFGCVFANEMNKLGRKCLIIDKRKQLGGNVCCKDEEGINVHLYGAHIFHTNDETIWNYVNSFAKFNSYINSPLAIYQDKVYNLPFNMNTFYQLWGTTTPEEAQREIGLQVSKFKVSKPTNLEEQALSLVGHDIYEYFIKGYSEKQWGRKAKELPAFLIKRIPFRFTYNNNYFDDKYQGIPIGGYNQLISGLTKGIEYRTNINYLKHKDELDSKANSVVFSGPIDEYFNFQLGSLEYRSLRFEHERKEMQNYQGNAVINFTEHSIPYTRIIEHKHFEFGKQPHTIITKEFPVNYNKRAEPYYPINDTANNKLYQKYNQMASYIPKIVFGGRLGSYKYYDMHQVIASALQKVKSITQI